MLTILCKTNNQHGILVDTSDSLISGNSVFQNSQQTTNTFDEIYVDHFRANVANNTIDGDSHSRYGINFHALWGSGNIATNNTIINEVTAPTNDVAQGTTWFNGGNGKTIVNDTVTFKGLGQSVIGNYLCIDPITKELLSGTTCTLSSERFKENIISLPDNALSEVMALRPVSFTFKNGYGDKGQATQLGFIAEEAVLTDPRLVPLNKEGLPSGFYYQNYTAILRLFKNSTNGWLPSIQLLFQVVVFLLNFNNGLLIQKIT